MPFSVGFRRYVPKRGSEAGDNPVDGVDTGPKSAHFGYSLIGGFGRFASRQS
jgi:hypothetical protein